jgi:hypothetical protein
MTWTTLVSFAIWRRSARTFRYCPRSRKRETGSRSEPSTAVGAVTGSQPTGGSISLPEEDLTLVTPST